jgi:hypothetical protein
MKGLKNKISLGILPLLFLISITGWSAEPDTGRVKLLTHKQYLKLDEKSQREYANEIRIILFEIEKRMADHFHDESEVGTRLRSWREAVAGLLWPEAWAQNFDPRCIYGGFFIQGRRCKPQAEEQFSFPSGNGHYKLKVSCTGGQVLCNPVVFGLKQAPQTGLASNEAAQATTKPFCVSAADRRNTTRDCFFASKGDDHASAILKYNPGLELKLRAGIEALCVDHMLANNKYFKNRQRAQKDMKDTCAWLEQRGFGATGRMGNWDRGSTRNRHYSPERDDQRNDRRSNEALNIR